MLFDADPPAGDDRCDEGACRFEEVRAVLADVGTGEPRVLIDSEPLDVSNEQLRVAGRRNDENLVLEIARCLVARQVVDVLGRMDEETVKLLRRHCSLDATHSSLELFFAERRPSRVRGIDTVVFVSHGHVSRSFNEGTGHRRAASIDGTELSSSRVYGWRGVSKIASADPRSTILLRCMT